MIQDPKLWTEQEIASVLDTDTLGKLLRTTGCSRCSLGCQEGLRAPVVYRGKADAKYAILGEGPGLGEDIEGIPFVGPAGKLLDRILEAIGLDRDHFYIGNVLKCRPIAPPGSGRQNLTPTTEQLKACRPFIKRELEILQPRLVALMGAVAVRSLLHINKPMKEVAGRDLVSPEFPETIFFAMYHPAYVLHSERDPGQLRAAKEAVWTQARKLRNRIDRLEMREPRFKEIE